MTDFNKIVGQLLGSGAAGGFAGGLAGGLASSMITSKKGRKLGKKALKMGGIAAVGALAYGAFQKYSGAQDVTRQQPAQPLAQSTPDTPPALRPPPLDSTFLPSQDDTAGQEQLGRTLVRAMLAAARSDGQLDAKESQAIFQRIESLELPPEDKRLMIEEMGRPVDMDAIVNSATSPEVAAEIYVASLLAIDVDTVAEQSYLAMLAARLQLPRQLVNELHDQVLSQTVIEES